MLMGAMLKDLRLKGSPAMGGGWKCWCDVGAAAVTRVVLWSTVMVPSSPLKDLIVSIRK